MAWRRDDPRDWFYRVSCRWPLARRGGSLLENPFATTECAMADLLQHSVAQPLFYLNRFTRLVLHGASATVEKYSRSWFARIVSLGTWSANR
jgi:hypothetical protein